MDQPSAEQLGVKIANGRKKEVIICIPTDLVNEVKSSYNKVKYCENNINLLYMQDKEKFLSQSIYNHFHEELGKAMEERDAVEKKFLAYIPNIIKPHTIQWQVDPFTKTLQILIVDEDID